MKIYSCNKNYNFDNVQIECPIKKMGYIINCDIIKGEKCNRMSFQMYVQVVLAKFNPQFYYKNKTIT